MQSNRQNSERHDLEPSNSQSNNAIPVVPEKPMSILMKSPRDKQALQQPPTPNPDGTIDVYQDQSLSAMSKVKNFNAPAPNFVLAS